jgi:DNA polymerase III subunit delta'
MNEIWDIVFEQVKAKEILNSIYLGRRVPHAFLFFGPEGVGKYFTALQFAKLINSTDDESKQDLIYKKISSLQEPYIKLVLPLPRGKGEGAEDSATEKLSKEIIDLIKEETISKIENPYHRITIENANTIKINSVREIRKYITTTTDEISYKFIIILDAHKMNETAQNALLKSLEEPPEGIVFIFITSDKEKLLPTIQSRCWQVNFEPLTSASVAGILINNFSIDKNLAERVAKFSEGSPLNAMDLINNQFENILERTISILRFSLAKKYHSAYKELSEFFKNNSDQSINILARMIKTWLNDVIKNRHSIFDYYFSEFSETLSKFNSRFGDADINKIFYSIDNLERLQTKNVNLNVVSLNLIFEIASLSIRK